MSSEKEILFADLVRNIQKRLGAETDSGESHCGTNNAIVNVVSWSARSDFKEALIDEEPDLDISLDMFSSPVSSENASSETIVSNNRISENNETHFKSKSNKVLIACDVCQKICRGVKAVFTHEQKHQNISRYYCPYDRCTKRNEKFQSVFKLKYHVTGEHGLDRNSVFAEKLQWKCRNCDKFGIGYTEYEKHVRLEFNEKRMKFYQDLADK